MSSPPATRPNTGTRGSPAAVAEVARAPRPAEAPNTAGISSRASIRRPRRYGPGGLRAAEKIVDHADAAFETRSGPAAGWCRRRGADARGNPSQRKPPGRATRDPAGSYRTTASARCSYWSCARRTRGGGRAGGASRRSAWPVPGSQGCSRRGGGAPGRRCSRGRTGCSSARGRNRRSRCRRRTCRASTGDRRAPGPASRAPGSTA